MRTDAYDICDCGDYRRQHEPDHGACKMCAGYGEVCTQFRLFQVAEVTWRRATKSDLEREVRRTRSPK